MNIFTESDKAFWEQQAFDEVYKFDTTQTSAQVITEAIAEDFSFRNISDEEFNGIKEIVEAAKVASPDYQAIYDDAFDAMIAEDDYWFGVIDEMIESGRYESAEHIHERIFDVSDWRENGFNAVQVNGIYDAVIQMTIAYWDVTHTVD